MSNAQINAKYEAEMASAIVGAFEVDYVAYKGEYTKFDGYLVRDEAKVAEAELKYRWFACNKYQDVLIDAQKWRALRKLANGYYPVFLFYGFGCGHWGLAKIPGEHKPDPHLCKGYRMFTPGALSGSYNAGVERECAMLDVAGFTMQAGTLFGDPQYDCGQFYGHE